MGSQAEFALGKAIKELTAANERIRELKAELAEWKAKGSRGQIAQWRADSLALAAEREVSDKMAAALNLALNSHGIMLPTDPPQDAWKQRLVFEVGHAAVAALAAIRKGEKA